MTERKQPTIANLNWSIDDKIYTAAHFGFFKRELRDGRLARGSEFLITENPPSAMIITSTNSMIASIIGLNAMGLMMKLMASGFDLGEPSIGNIDVIKVKQEQLQGDTPTS